jgi:tetratricopeptide (TPR) repeat protein
MQLPRLLCPPRKAGWYDVKSTMDTLPSISRSVMFLWTKLRGTYLIFVLISAAILTAQTGRTGAANETSLQQSYNDAEELQRAGRLNEAAEQYRTFLAGALGQLAMGYGLLQDYAHAAPLFDEALTLEPGSPSLLLDYARTALTLGDLDHAKTLAAEFIRRYPNDRERLAEAHQVLGRALLKQNRYREARKELEAAVALDPTFPNGYDLAVACLDLDDEKCAGQIFAEMEKSFGDTAEIHLAFGRAYGDSDLQPRAAEEIQKAIEENPRLPDAHYLLAALMLATGGDENQVARAEAELIKELAISPNDAKTYTLLGELSFLNKNYPDAEKYLKKSTELDPQNPDTFLHLGQTYFATNHLAEAEAAFRQCIRLTTDVSRNRYQVQRAHYLLGRILVQSGQNSAGLAETKIAQDLSKKVLAQDRSDLAGLLNTTGRPDSPASPAEAATVSSSSPAPVNQQMSLKVEAQRERVKLAVADSYNNLGAIAATSADYSRAVTYFERAAAWNPSLEGLDYNWGRAAFAGSQFTDAIMPLSRYLKSHPDDIGARSVLAISHFMTGNYRGCIDVLEPAIGKVDLAPQTEYVYAESMIRTGHLAAGAERMEVLEKLHPEIPDVHRSLGEALGQQGEKHRALEEIRTAIRLSPRDADSRYDLGKMELEGGDSAAAIPELEAAARLSPDSEKFHRELANAYTAAFRPADAQKEMETSDLLRARVQSNTSPRQVASPEP